MGFHITKRQKYIYLKIRFCVLRGARYSGVQMSLLAAQQEEPSEWIPGGLLCALSWRDELSSTELLTKFFYCRFECSNSPLCLVSNVRCVDAFVRFVSVLGCC